MQGRKALAPCGEASEGNRSSYKPALSRGCLSNTERLEEHPHRHRMNRRSWLNNDWLFFHTIHQKLLLIAFAMWSENSELVLSTLKKYLIYCREKLQALAWMAISVSGKETTESQWNKGYEQESALWQAVIKFSVCALNQALPLMRAWEQTPI